MTIIVTGCQRSGTTIAAHILGNARQHLVLEDNDWLPTPEHVNILKDLIDSGRDQMVIQSPTALYNFHYIHHLIPSLHWVGVKRKKKDIINSMIRVKWMQDDYPDFLPFYNHHIAYMNTLWNLLKQQLPQDNWTEVKYPQELTDYPEYIPKNQRINFTIKQTKLNTPKGPRYWVNDAKGSQKTPKTTTESSTIFNQTQSSENTSKISEKNNKNL